MALTHRISPFRNLPSALDAISGLRSSLPAAPSTVRRLTVEVTKYCSVGCSHCKYNAPFPHKTAKRQNLFLSPDAINACADFISEAAIEHLIITGGGEPTHEMDSVCRLIEWSMAPKISIYTAGQWGATSDECMQHLDKFLRCLKESRAAQTLELRLSIDDFHAARIGIRPLATIIQSVIQSGDLRKLVTLRIRTVNGHEQSVEDVASLLGGTYHRDDDFLGFLDLGRDETILVDRLNLIPAGRQKSGKAASRDLGEVWSNLEGIQSKYGDGWPTYVNGGLNLGIRPSGKVYIYGASPENFGAIPERAISDVLRDLVHDPITSALSELGLPEFFRQLSYCAPKVAANALDTCEPSILVPFFCARPKELLLAKLVGLFGLAVRDRNANAALTSILGVSGESNIDLETIKKSYEECHD